MTAEPPRRRLVEQSVLGTTVLMIDDGGVLRPFKMTDLAAERREARDRFAAEMQAHLAPLCRVSFFGRALVVDWNDVRRCLDRLIE